MATTDLLNQHSEPQVRGEDDRARCTLSLLVPYACAEAQVAEDRGGLAPGQLLTEDASTSTDTRGPQQPSRSNVGDKIGPEYGS